MTIALRFIPVVLAFALLNPCYGRDLAFVVNDAGIASGKLADIFGSSLRKRGFEVQRLTSDGKPEGSTLVKKLSDAIDGAKIGKDDRVVFYFECDGTTVWADKNEEPNSQSHYLCPGPPPHENDVLRMSELKALAKTVLGKTTKLGVIDGSCGGGSTVLAFRDVPQICALSKTTAGRVDTFGSSVANKVVTGLQEAPAKNIVASLGGLGRYWQAVKMHNSAAMGVFTAMETPLRSGCVSSLEPFDVPYRDALRRADLADEVPLSRGSFDLLDGVEDRDPVEAENRTRGQAIRSAMWRDDNIHQVASCDRTPIAPEFGNLKEWKKSLDRILRKEFEDSFLANFPELNAMYQAAGVHLSDRPFKRSQDLIDELMKSGAVLQQAETQEVLLARQINKVVDKLEAMKQSGHYDGAEQLYARAAKLRNDFSAIQQGTAVKIIRLAALGAILREIQCAVDAKGKPDPCADFTLTRAAI